MKTPLIALFAGAFWALGLPAEEVSSPADRGAPPSPRNASAKSMALSPGPPSAPRGAPMALPAPAGDAAKAPKAPPKASPPAEKQAEKAAGKAGEKPAEASEEDTERFRAALLRIQETSNTQEILSAAAVLRKGFPSSRTALHEAATKGTAKVKAFAIRILGEEGEPEEDFEVVKAALDDADVKVRLAAVMALRRLGKGEAGLAALTAYLVREKEPNNRKMTITTFQDWREKGAMPALVSLLRAERDKGVRGFAVRTLQVLSRETIGDDVEAWEKYLERKTLAEQTKHLMEGTDVQEEKEE